MAIVRESSKNESPLGRKATMPLQTAITDKTACGKKYRSRDLYKKNI
jgi:hypothetical protein